MKLKFCGLTRIEDIEAANETRPDYIGFVFVDNAYRTSLAIDRFGLVG